MLKSHCDSLQVVYRETLLDSCVQMNYSADILISLSLSMWTNDMQIYACMSSFQLSSLHVISSFQLSSDIVISCNLELFSHKNSGHLGESINCASLARLIVEANWFFCSLHQTSNKLILSSSVSVHFFSFIILFLSSNKFTTYTYV